MALFTPEVAREMSAKAMIARKANRESRINRLAMIDRLLAQAAQKAEQPQDTSKPEAYVSNRLACTRVDIDLIDKEIRAELKRGSSSITCPHCKELVDYAPDPTRVDKLASAIEKLSRIEQNLAGRPGPGQYKPTAPRPTQATHIVEPE